MTEKESLKLVSKDAVDDEIHGWVDGHEEIADTGHFINQDVGCFEYVHDHGQDVEDEKDGHNAEQHGCQPNFSLLRIGQ